MPVSALPGRYFIGDFGPAAREYVRFLSRAGVRYWQFLPISPVDDSFSPFSPDRDAAIEPRYISPEDLVLDGLLTSQDLDEVEHLVVGQENATSVDYKKAWEVRKNLLAKAFTNFRRWYTVPELKKEFNAFVHSESYWLDYTARYQVLREKFGHNFMDWHSTYRNAANPRTINIHNNYELHFAQFVQFLADRAFMRLKEYAHSYGIALIGDMPAYVNRYSAEVWAYRSSFMVDFNLEPTFVSGVAPDAGFPAGQLWGSLLYDYEGLKKSKFEFHVARYRRMSRLFDVVREDHFVSKHQFWAIPQGGSPADGKTLAADGYALYNEVRRQLGKLPPVIVEDLGATGPEVEALRDHFGFLGMRVLVLSDIGGKPDPVYHPDNWVPQSVGYRGGHDFATPRSWVEEDPVRIGVLKGTDERLPIHLRAVERTLGSKSNLAMIDGQDLLGLGEEGRINTPGTYPGHPDPSQRKVNWVFRFGNRLQTPNDQLELYESILRRMIFKAGRAP